MNYYEFENGVATFLFRRPRFGKFTSHTIPIDALEFRGSLARVVWAIWVVVFRRVRCVEKVMNISALESALCINPDSASDVITELPSNQK